MTRFQHWTYAVVALFTVICSQPAMAAQETPGKGGLFVNLTTDDPWRAGMALHFSRNVLEKGHPVVVYLNVAGVRVAATNIPLDINAMTGKSPHEMLKELIKAGGKVLICQPCMKHAGISKDQILDGVTLSTPEVIQPELFAEGVRVMSW